MAKFYLVDFEAALALGLALEKERPYLGYFSFVIEDTPSGPQVLATDGGEPEDQTLSRDWAWVVPALNKAFEDGKKEE